MSHIPHHKLLPQDMVDIFDHGPKDDPHDTPVVHRMHASDARHAMSVDPERYTLDNTPADAGDMAEETPENDGE